MVHLFQSDVLQSVLNPRSILRALWKRKLSIVLLWLVGSGAAVALVTHLRAVYAAEALILVESQKIPESFVAATVQTALEARLDTLKQQVLSHERLWKLIQEFDLYAKQRKTHSQEEVVDMLRHDINIRLERGWSTSRPGAFRVSYETYSPTTVAEIANRIGRFFIDENLRAREVEAAATSAFLDSQLAESKKKLQEQEARLKDFKEAYIGELPQQQTTLLSAASQSRAELLGIQEALSRAQQNKLTLESSLGLARDNLKRQQELARQRAELDAASRALVSLSPGPVVGPPPAAPPSELDKARAQLQGLHLRYEDKHPEVQRVLQEVARLEQLDQEASALVRRIETPPPAFPRTAQAQRAVADPPRREPVPSDDPAIRALEAQVTLAVREIQTLESRRQQVIQDAADIQARMQKLPIREQQLSAITRDYDTSRANYQSLLDKKLAADVAANMERWQKAERFVMLDAARVPEKPVRPKRALLTAIGSLLSLLGAAALALLLELKKNVVLGEWELPAGTVIIGRVPRMEIEKA